jgi:putative protease
MSTVELLAPAGNPEALDAALSEGADAVYLGLRSFNARMRSSNFAFNQFEAAVEVCHKALKKVYVTVNTVFEQREADRMYQLLQYIERVGADGVIVQDLGVAELAGKYFPDLRLHASTQMNIASAKGANLLSRRGFRRAVLARELSLDEIRAVAQGTNLELEVFVHGALCVSASGLCLFSSYLGGKSANRGLCAQACRRLYSTESGSGYYFSPDDLELIDRVPDLAEAGVCSFKIEGRMKSAEYVGAVVSAYRHLLDNYKIDPGRALLKARSILQSDFARSKTHFNIDGALTGAAPVASPEAAAPDGIEEGVAPEAGEAAGSAAGKSAMAVQALPGRIDLGYIRPDQAGGTGLYLGRVKEARSVDDKLYALIDTGPVATGTNDYDEEGWDGEEGPVGLGAEGLAEGDSLRIHAADDSGRYTAKVKEVRESPKGALVRFDGDFKAGDSIYLVQKRSLGKRWKPVLPRDLDRYHKFPSRDRAPDAEIPKLEKASLEALPDGIYTLVGRVADLHVILSARPKAAMILFDHRTARQLRDHEKEIPFKRNELIFWLDPYFPEGDSTWLQGELEYWIGRGQRIFVANNLAHLGMLRSLSAGLSKAASARAASAKATSARPVAAKEGSPAQARPAPKSRARAPSDEIVIIAGPWLYSFNDYAAAFLVEEGASFIVPPIEIGKQAFMKVAESLPSKALMPVAFSFPPLFRIRADLTRKNDFRVFEDRDGSAYELHGRGDYSTVTPLKPFSIVDRVPFLKKEGIGKVILDFSQVDLQKPLYRQVFRACEEGSVLPETGRFNWKMGFWYPEEGGPAD